MYALESFYNNICKLSKSLVIKFDLVIKAMEYSTNFPLDQAESEYFVVPEKMLELRFYRHIAGELYRGIEYTPSFSTKPDEQVFIKVIENETLLPLTKELLDQYSLTKEELLKFEDYYLSLVEQYPTMILYIHGCLYPVDVRELLIGEDGHGKVIKEGTILSYNKTFVEEQEWALIGEIETFIRQYTNRWFVRNYITSDNLFLQAFLAGLFSQLPGKIFSLRCQKINTNQAHTFFLEAFFRSNFELWEPVQKLNKETIWWLYKNLPGIIKYQGRNATLEKLLLKVFNRNNVGIGGFYITRGDAIKTNTQYDRRELAFKPGATIIKAEPLNANYNIKGNGQVPPRDLLDSELKLTNHYNADHTKYLVDTGLRELSTGTSNRANTKVLEVSTLKEYTGFNTDKLRLIMDYWCFLLHMGYYGSFTSDEFALPKIEFTDPNTGSKFNINAKIGFYMVLKVMLHSVKALSTPIKKYTITTVLDPNARIERILKDYLYPDGLTELLRKEIVDSYPILNKALSSVKEVKEHIEQAILYSKNLWISSSNSESVFVSANIRMFLYLATYQKEVIIHESPLELTIDEILSEQGLNNFNIYGAYNHQETVKELVFQCLGMELNSSDRLEELLKAYKEILQKLTSYTLHPLGAVNEGADSYIYGTSTNFIKMKKGILKLDESKVIGFPCNDDQHSVSFIPYIPNEEIRNYEILGVPAQDTPNIPRRLGSFFFKTDTDFWNVSRYENNGASVEILDYPYIPTNAYKYKRQYIELNDDLKVVTVEKHSHRASFEGDREVIKANEGWVDEQPNSRIDSDDSKGVYEVKKHNNEEEAIISLEDPLKD